MKNSSDLLKSGGYATKQIFAQCSILRYSHGARFKKGLELVKRYKPTHLLDYGCGDATFLILCRDLVKHKTGIEIDTNQLQGLKQRFLEEEDFSFFHTSAAQEQRHDMVTCFEVLEHCTDQNIRGVLSRLSDLAAPGAHIIISVPKETGLSMCIKQIVRRILAMRKFGTYEYTETYSIKEFLQTLFASKNTQIERKFVQVEYNGEKILTCGHKGFNWKRLKLTLEDYFEIQSVEFTPEILPFGLVSSQVWFVCKNSYSQSAK